MCCSGVALSRVVGKREGKRNNWLLVGASHTNNFFGSIPLSVAHDTTQFANFLVPLNKKDKKCFNLFMPVLTIDRTVFFL